MELRILWLQRCPCLRRWVVIWTLSIIVNKENPSSICVLNVSHILWFDKYLYFSILCMIYLTHLYICIILYLEYWLLTSEGEASLKALEEKQSGRGQARINHRVSGESFLSFYFFYYTLESIACKFLEYVGNPRPSVIRCLFLYNNYCTVFCIVRFFLWW